MKRAITIAAMLAAAGLAGAQMFAQLFGGAEEWTPAALGPVAWWRAESNALDSAGANVGTWSGTEAYAAGKVGNAFATTSGYPYFSGDLLRPGTGDFTVSAWVSSGPAALAFFAKRQNAYPYQQITLWIGEINSSGAVSPSGKISAIIMQSSAGLGARRYYVSNSSYFSGAFELVTISRQGGSVSIYVNGAPVDITEVVSNGGVPSITSADVVSVGGAAGISNFANPVDDVLIFNRALTAAEIKLLYDETVKRNGKAW